MCCCDRADNFKIWRRPKEMEISPRRACSSEKAAASWYGAMPKAGICHVPSFTSATTREYVSTTIWSCRRRKVARGGDDVARKPACCSACCCLVCRAAWRRCGEIKRQHAGVYVEAARLPVDRSWRRVFKLTRGEVAASANASRHHVAATSNVRPVRGICLGNEAAAASNKRAGDIAAACATCALLHRGGFHSRK